MNEFDLMRKAIAQADHTQRAADSVSNDMARMLRGRLRKVSPNTLASLKKELKEFNAHTGRWK